jgi:16S rRNA (guanine966-N2)-methyltransferase
MTTRVRAAIFNILAHGGLAGPGLAGCAVLDLYAGSGSLGLEALSRGAARCVFVEKNPPAVRVLERNIEALGFAHRGRVVRADARRVDALLVGGPFDLVFADPPYEAAAEIGEGSEIGAVLSHLVEAGLVDGAWLAVIRTPRRAGALWVPPSAVIDQAREYGADRVWFVRPGGQS